MKAVISECGLYRYRLDRFVQLGDGPVYAFLGVNPSIANAVKNDATALKWIGFTKVCGGSRYIAWNPFAYIATDVNELRNAGDPIGPENDDYLYDIIAEADVLVPCWGSRNKLPKHLRDRLDEVLDILKASEKPVMKFGLTASGDPAHPLFLPYTTVLTPMFEGGQQ